MWSVSGHCLKAVTGCRGASPCFGVPVELISQAMILKSTGSFIWLEYF